MKVRKTNDIVKVLRKKGFTEVSSKRKTHHIYYYFTHDGKMTSVYTYFSHSLTEYNKRLMSEIKNQLRFKDNNQAEDFFDCPLTKEMYAEHLKKTGAI